MKRISFIIILMLSFLHINAFQKDSIFITVNNVQRNIIKFTPDNVTTGLPLMIVTHGMNQNPTYQYQGDRLYELIDTEKFILAYLASNGGTWDIDGTSDLEFVDAAIDKMDELHQIDRNRLYWSGFSMGSMLIYHGIRSDIGKKFAAFAPTSGILFGTTPWTQRTTPVNLIHCHSYDDGVFEYNSLAGKYDYSIRDYVTHFATDLDQAGTYTKTEGYQPNASELGYIYGDKEVWTDGTNGSEVEMFSAHGGGHWPTLAYKYEIWNFCKRFSLNSSQSQTYQNPVIFADFPDPDVIRVGDTYYMVSTTMHHFPGATIVKSTDLVNWEYCAQPLTQLANTDKYNLQNGENAYSKGMWACSMKYHNGKFYLLINGNDAGGWLLTATDPEGEWEKKQLSRGYYDPGMLFDNGKVYVACGINNIQMCELDENFNFISEQNVISKSDAGLEGCHLYKKDGYYYIYATYGGWPSGQVVFRSTNIYGPYEEQMLVEKYINSTPNTIHQGALFDTPTGEWWTIMQQDLGCMGRMPNLQPVTWVNNWPVVGNNGVPYTTYTCPTTSNPMDANPLPTTDNFLSSSIGMQWEWNHNPDNSAWSLSERQGWLRLKTSGVADKLTQARNMLTQRIFAYHDNPSTPSTGTICIDASHLEEGDRAGICILQDPYAFLAVEKKNGQLQLIWRQDQLGTNDDFTPTEVVQTINQSTIYLRAALTYGTSKTQFSYSTDNNTYTNIGDQTTLHYNLSVFVGARFGLFCYATEAGHTGYADFDWFATESNYEEPVTSYELGDNIVDFAPTVWEGQTDEYHGLVHTAYERYNSGSLPVGDVLTQSLTGLKNGTYKVTLEMAGSYTSGRGFTCPTGEGLSLVFANGEFRVLPVVERGWVSSIEPVTVNATVADGTLRYGIYNIAEGGNWYIANVTGITYVSENTDNTFAVRTSADHGTITPKAVNVAAGTTVNLTVTPDAMYALENLSVTTCTGENVALDGTSFVMPAVDVTVTATFVPSYSANDDIVSLAPTEWTGQTNSYSGLGHTAYERYNSGSIGAGDVLTQTLTGLKNGTYAVTLEVAASYTPERGFTCPTGSGLCVAFANETQEGLEVVERGWVTDASQITLTTTVNNGTLTYGIRNLANAGNWYVANVKSVVYEPQSAPVESYELTVSSAGVATVYLPYDAVIPEADFFVVTTVKEMSGNTAYLKEITGGILPAYTGVMIFANPGTYTFVSSSTPATESVESLLHGVTENTPVSTLAAQENKSIYVLSRGIQEYVGFKPAGTTVTTIPANKAYLPLGIGIEVLAKFIPVSFDDLSTSVKMIPAASQDQEVIYDLTGKRKDALMKGVNIIKMSDGRVKKVFFK